MTDIAHLDSPAEKRIALVTGANRGIGLEISRGLVAEGFIVLMGSRSLERGTAAAESIGPDAHAIVLDVTDAATIAAAAHAIAATYGRLDVLVNNAGIAHRGPRTLTLEEVVAKAKPSIADLDEVRGVFETNVFGVLAVTQAMLPLLRRAPAARIVNMSLAIALELEAEGIKVNAVCPGFTATELNNYAGHRSVEEGARAAIHMALIGPDGPTGTFSDDNGTIPW
jgi:NAD(P)-dependent dehydrogenase (short-subunit alcohol dehydrogenase family)